MTVLRSSFGELLEPGLRKVFFNEFDRWAKEYDKIAKTATSKKKFEEDLLVVGLGIMGSKGEGASVLYDDISQGWKTTYTHTTYAGGIRITQEMYEDDLYGVMKDLTGALARSAQQRKEVDVANILNRAENAAYVGADGVELISAVHPLSIGGTQSNELAAAADLDASSLQDAIDVLETAQDERGLNIAMRAKLLVVPPALQYTAYELLKSEFKPGTADNEVNAIGAKGLQFVVNHYLTDSDAWYLLSDEHKINLFDRIPISFYKGNDFDTDDCKFKARMRYSSGWSDWRGVTGSQGA